METKAVLNKPYTEEERLNFIVEYNHNLGYEIKETEEGLEAWGYTQEEIEEQKRDRIDNLTMTALDFINCLKQYGLTDEMVETYLNNNLAAKHQLTFCQNVYCKVAKSFMPITLGEVTISAQMVEEMFKDKNNA